MALIHKVSREIHYFLKCFFHFLAMYVPNSHMKRFFYRIRGTKIGNYADIAPGVFLEDFFPELITLGDNVDIGPGVIIVTHDSSGKCISSRDITWTKSVVIENNVYIGAGAIILPGVRVGHHSIIGAGSVVTRDIPPESVAYGSPARVQLTSGEWLRKKDCLPLRNSEPNTDAKKQ
jgi:acetyltransferase-like isoleucine patch superfamily enzyme